jgi:hypothetical protein
MSSDPFSEFSYGYAAVREIERMENAIEAPEFPSLYKEGQEGGGYDVRINFGIPLFIQFKLVEQLVRKSAKHYKLLGVPYYKMPIRSGKYKQHKMLVDLQSSGENVFYLAPEFHLTAELNHYYLNNKVIENSAAFSPKDIGYIKDNEYHYVIFQKESDSGYFCSSTPKEIKKYELSKSLKEVLTLSDAGPKRLDETYWNAVSNKMIQIIEETKAMKFERPSRKIPSTSLSEEKAIEHIEKMAYVTQKIIEPSVFDNSYEYLKKHPGIYAVGQMARIFFESELLIFPTGQYEAK